ncbi:hypothetical protein Enr13x_36700 [Stieleria neptunia]|uniref:ISKra4 family transposase n=1 Tax=Stieleria neptunia TaxID=2527979 RepID=A0A518HSH3_9BACT|nr:hypothetical protein [Stieleria neptunia]QDV40653.1 hypothetical protein Enr13x_04870 [Stieleria neptunia]QDV42657.1 hypothetical protein Enr13x_25060 [Stieleria neptunia]QDV43810.1 hypothetical protein Enr13x_36700 [Stieleria neptunia]
MDVKVNAGSLVSAIAETEISVALDKIVDEFRENAISLVASFAADQSTPEQTHNVENQLHQQLLEVGRRLIEWLFSQLEPAIDEMPGTVSFREQSHRRLPDKALRSDIVTRFGKVSLLRARYRRGRAGRVIFPIEISLGIEDGFTPAAADRAGKQFAACGSSQERTLAMITDQMGTKIGTEKLRKLVGTLADGMEPHREEAQVEELMRMIGQARGLEKTPVLSVSRDGVALGLAQWSSFEMASVACVSVLADGKKLGTVYLGRVPETNQATLSNQLTSLLTATIRGCGNCVPEIVYVSDAGKVETAYWRNTLQAFFVDGRRIKITRVVDYYHAAERLTVIADALKLGKDKTKRIEWLEHARWLLLQPGGHGRVLRSIAKMRELYCYKASATDEAEKAERYLRRYSRFMDYATMKSRGYPIGSGVVESACKQIVSERMKLSGMRWSKEGGQRTMTLRCLLLSGIWDAVYKKWLAAKPAVRDLIITEDA